MLLRKQLPVTVYIVFLLLVLTIIFTPVFYRAAEFGDYAAHYNFAASIEDGEQLRMPHVLYHIVVIAVKNTFEANSQVETTIIAILLIRLLFGAVLFLAVKYRLPANTSNALIMFSVLLILFMAPIYLWQDLPFFLGYINYLPYHSPTQHLMLLFVVPVSLVALRAISPKPFKSLNQRIFFTLFSAVLILYLSLSKPSYSIAILPAIGLVVLYRLVRRLPVDWLLLVVGVGAPFILMLGLQYIITYGDPTRADVGIRWLYFFRLQRFRDWEIISRLGLSVVLPLLVYILYFREARKDVYLNFSWLVFGISLVWSYLFYERGLRASNGNFVWSAYASMFIVIFSTIVFILKQHTLGKLPNLSWRTAIVAIALSVHVISGIGAANAFASLDLKNLPDRFVGTGLTDVLDCGYATFIPLQVVSAQRTPIMCP